MADFRQIWSGGAEGDRTPDLCNAIASNGRRLEGKGVGAGGFSRERGGNRGSFANPARYQTAGAA
jgi:hypothetical protein